MEPRRREYVWDQRNCGYHPVGQAPYVPVRSTVVVRSRHAVESRYSSRKTVAAVAVIVAAIVGFAVWAWALFLR